MMPVACQNVIAPTCNTEGSMPFHNNITNPLKAAIPSAAIAMTKGIFFIQYFFIRIIFSQSYISRVPVWEWFSVTGGKTEVNTNCAGDDLERNQNLGQTVFLAMPLSL